jgi:hypothetical protein
MVRRVCLPDTLYSHQFRYEAGRLFRSTPEGPLLDAGLASTEPLPAAGNHKSNKYIGRECN